MEKVEELPQRTTELMTEMVQAGVPNGHGQAKHKDRRKATEGLRASDRDKGHSTKVIEQEVKKKEPHRRDIEQRIESGLRNPRQRTQNIQVLETILRVGWESRSRGCPLSQLGQIPKTDWDSIRGTTMFYLNHVPTSTPIAQTTSPNNHFWLYIRSIISSF